MGTPGGSSSLASSKQKASHHFSLSTDTLSCWRSRVYLLSGSFWHSSFGLFQLSVKSEWLPIGRPEPGSPGSDSNTFLPWSPAPCALFFFLTYSFFIYLTECVLVAACVHAQSLQSCLTLCDPMDCTPPGFSVHGILQARIREWVAIFFSKRSSQYRD